MSNEGTIYVTEYGDADTRVSCGLSGVKANAPPSKVRESITVNPKVRAGVVKGTMRADPLRANTPS